MRPFWIQLKAPLQFSPGWPGEMAMWRLFCKLALTRCVAKNELDPQIYGGEGGIRTLEGLLTLTPLAGERFQPLSHLSGDMERLSRPPLRRQEHIGVSQASAILTRIGILPNVQFCQGSRVRDARRSVSAAACGRKPKANQYGRRRSNRASVLRANGLAPLCIYSGLLTFNSLVDFFTMYGDISGSVYAETRLIAFNAEYGDRHVPADHHALPNATGQYQHIQTPSWYLPSLHYWSAAGRPCSLIFFWPVPLHGAKDRALHQRSHGKTFFAQAGVGRNTDQGGRYDLRTRSPENLPERARDLRWHQGQRFVEVLGLSSSRLSKIGSAAALAADPLGHRTDKPPRVKRVREVL